MIKSALNNLSGPSIANIQPGGKDRWQRWLRQFGEKERHATIDWCMLSMPSFIVAAGKPFLPVHAPPPLALPSWRRLLPHHQPTLPAIFNLADADDEGVHVDQRLTKPTDGTEG